MLFLLVIGNASQAHKDRFMAFQMIDVGEKASTFRESVAEGRIWLGAEVFKLVAEKKLAKGDALALAEIAGIQGAKRTCDILPLCHSIELSGVNVECRLEVLSSSVHVQAFARCYGKTGVEMEALMAVSGALLCIHDLTKMYNAASRIGDITLVEKRGGKSGHWKNSSLSELSNPSNPSNPANPSNASNAADLQPWGKGVVSANTTLSLHATSVALLTVSDTCAKHPDRDVSGKILWKFFENKGAQVKASAVVADDVSQIDGFLRRAVFESQCQLVISTGGTGMGPRDCTPFAFQKFSERNGGSLMPGIGELLRKQGAQHTPMSWLSGSCAYKVKESILICLPGSRNAVAEGLECLSPLFSHMLHTSMGGGHSPSSSHGHSNSHGHSHSVPSQMEGAMQ